MREWCQQSLPFRESLNKTEQFSWFKPLPAGSSPLQTAGSRVCQRANTAGAWLGAVLQHTHCMHCERGSHTLCRAWAQAAHAGEPDPTPDPWSWSSTDVEEGEVERVSRGGGGGRCRGEKACAE